MVWNQIKTDLKKDDVGAREFLIRVTGKQSSDGLMSSDIDRLVLAIKKEKAKPPTEDSAQPWGSDLSLTV
jgi:hypothetical protein